MKTQDKYRSIPHGELIVENGCIVVPSIFMFETITQMQNFIHSCKMLNCIVRFENEGMIITPTDNGVMDAKLASYGMVINCPKAAENYIKYLFHKDNMMWDNVEKEG